jgi:hypothetical protein
MSDKIQSTPPIVFFLIVLQDKRQKFAEYSLETFNCVKMENPMEIIHGFFKFYAEEKSILKYEFSAYSAAQYARDFQDE